MARIKERRWFLNLTLTLRCQDNIRPNASSWNVQWNKCYKGSSSGSYRTMRLLEQ